MPLVSLERAFRCPCRELSSSTLVLVKCILEVSVAIDWLFIIVLVEVLVLAIPLVPIHMFLSIELEVSLLMFHNDVISLNDSLILYLLNICVFFWLLGGPSRGLELDLI